MANIGTFTADEDGFTGTLRTLTLNVKDKLTPNDKGNNENARLPPAGDKPRNRRGVEEDQYPSGQVIYPALQSQDMVCT